MPEKEKRVKMTFRFRPEFAQYIRTKSTKERMEQVLVLETALAVAGKGIKFQFRAVEPPKE